MSWPKSGASKKVSNPGIVFPTLSCRNGKNGGDEHSMLMEWKEYRKSIRPIAVAIGGIWFLFLALYTVFGRLLIQADGVIVSRVMSAGDRQAAIYVLQDSIGRHSFTAGATDASLSRSLPIGSHIAQKRWQIRYTIDGRLINDFPIFCYGGMAVVGVGFYVLLLDWTWTPKKPG
jgi:hypothetical protein